MRRLCVFCGSSVGNRPVYRETARQFGSAMARRGLELVFGGGHIGLMGVLADAVLEAGGAVTGVIPQALVDRELAHSRLTHLHIVHTMHQRKALMADLSDGFAALPGGFGTADEMFEILTWAQLSIHAKPVGLLNVAGFFTSLLDWLDRAVEEGFLRANHRRLLQRAETPDRLLDLLLQYQPPSLEPKGVEPDNR
jgi:uncharacterized protein (TIGR00730 family)